MDLTKQLQISEKNWNQEKLELLGRFKDEQQQAEQQVKELQNKINQVRAHGNVTSSWDKCSHDDQMAQEANVLRACGGQNVFRPCALSVSA